MTEPRYDYPHDAEGIACECGGYAIPLIARQGR